MIVVFRKDKKHEEIVAVFAERANNRGELTCYAHIGQHSSCDLEWYRQKTRPASPEEYSGLLQELKTIYKDLDLEVRKRLPALTAIK